MKTRMDENLKKREREKKNYQKCSNEKKRIKFGKDKKSVKAKKKNEEEILTEDREKERV